MSFWGLGALLSIAGGWLGDRFSPRLVLSTAFLCTAAIGFLLFVGIHGVAVQSALTFAFGIAASGVLYVNLAAYHVKALQSSLASRGSGMFVTTFYGASAVGGYLMGWLANQGGWAFAAGIQITLLPIAAALVAGALRPDQLSR